MTAEQKSIRSTFITLRVGLGAIGLCFPFILWGGGKLAGFHLQESMSAYYHATKICTDSRDKQERGGAPATPEVQSSAATNDGAGIEPKPCLAGSGALRNVFVGILFIVGAVLLLYRGFSVWENSALSIAGVSAIFIAMFPMSWTEETTFESRVHGTSALIFFASIAFVATFCSDKTLKLVRMPTPSPTRGNRYKLIYLVLSIAMLLSPVLAIIFNYTTGQTSKTFWMETFGILAFGLFWLVKTQELASGEIEKASLEGQIDVKRNSLT